MAGSIEIRTLQVGKRYSTIVVQRVCAVSIANCLRELCARFREFRFGGALIGDGSCL